MFRARRLSTLGRGFVAALSAFFCASWPALAADPIKIGLSISLTGGNAPLGKQVLAGLEIWRDDINAKGGLLSRRVEIVYYDDQTTAAAVPTIYNKLIDVDKVDLILGPYGTNFIAAAMPTIIQKKLMTIGILGFNVNSEFKYPRYFSMNVQGSGLTGFTRGFFEAAARAEPRPKTVALLGADAEFGKNAIEGARQNAKDLGFTIVYDRYYPPATTDFTSILRAVQAAKPDVVFAASYAPDSVGIVRAANEVKLDARMFGGALLGLLASPIKVQLGPLLNGIVSYELNVPSVNLKYAGTREFMQKYRTKATGAGIDPLGYTFPPFAYAAGQVLARAVSAVGNLDHDKLAAYLRQNKFETIVGEIAFAPDGEWTNPRNIYAQFRNVAPGDLQQFRDMARQVVVWPPEVKTGEVVYPYSAARQ